MAVDVLRSHVGGRWVAGNEEYELISPATGRVLARVAGASTDDVDTGVAAARASFEDVRWSPMRERSALCHRVADLISERAESLAVELAEEHGKPLHEARGEIAAGVDGFRLAAEEIKRLEGYSPQTADPNKRVLVIRQNRGVWALLTPWNFPFNIPIEYLGPALATGSPFVWKPAPSSARIAARLTEIILEAGGHSKSVNLVLTDSIEPARHLVRHQSIDAVGLTGGSATGRIVAEMAWDKHLLLELGGNGPVIVLDDADLGAALGAIGHAAFTNAGQVCSAAGRLLVADRAADELVAEICELAKGIVLGAPLDDGVTMGPLHTQSVAQTMDRHISDALDRGGRILFGGARAPGFPTDLFYQPTVIDEVSPDANVNAEETFGPIAPIVRLKNDDEILEAANSNAHGLVAAVFTSSISRAFHFAERLETGTVVINDTSNYWELHLPFGGRQGKESGRGRLGGRHTLEEFTQLKTISFDTSH